MTNSRRVVFASVQNLNDGNGATKPSSVRKSECVQFERFLWLQVSKLHLGRESG